MRLHLAIIGIILLVSLLALPLTMAVSTETKSGPAPAGKNTGGKQNDSSTCAGALMQLQTEATALFGFSSGFPTEVVTLKVISGDENGTLKEVPFGILARFANSPFAYGRAIPMNKFTHAKGILVLRTEQTEAGIQTKMSGVVYDQTGGTPDPQLVFGHLVPITPTWIPGALETGIWDLNYPAAGVTWGGTYQTDSAINWDCNIGS